MRSAFATFCLCSILLSAGTAAAADLTSDELLRRGVDSYRAAKYQDAVTDLNAAAQAYLSTDQMQKYVDSGRFETLGRLETALVYLALAESKLGHDPAARDAILRLSTAERIEPVYAGLPLQADAAEFEALAKRLTPETALPPNVALARGGAPAGTPVVVQTTATVPAAPPVTSAAPAPVAAASTPAPEPSTPVATVPQVAATAVTTGEPVAAPAQTTSAISPEQAAADRERYIEKRLAEERIKIEKAAEERIAAEREASRRELEQRVAAEREAAQKSAAQQIAAAQQTAQEQIEQARKNAQEQIAAAQRDAEQRVAAAHGATRNDDLATVREADSLAIRGRLYEARGLYAKVTNAPEVSRDILVDAAVGLYRTGGFREAVYAFQRLVPFAKGEEDLRFYNAVALYESGNYAEAKKELECALPYIEHTNDVTSYQKKIALTAGR